MSCMPVRDILACLVGFFSSLILFSCSASVSPNFALGEDALNKKNYDEAIEYFQSYLAHFPDDGNAHLQLGIALLKKGDLREAVNHFKESIALNPEDEASRAFIKKSIFDEAQTFFSEGKQDTGMRYLTAYLTINPDDVDAHIILAKEFIKMGSTRNAINSLNKAASLDAKHPDVVELLDYFSGGFH